MSLSQGGAGEKTGTGLSEPKPTGAADARAGSQRHAPAPLSSGS